MAAISNGKAVRQWAGSVVCHSTLSGILRVQRVPIVYIGHKMLLLAAFATRDFEEVAGSGQNLATFGRSIGSGRSRNAILR